MEYVPGADIAGVDIAPTAREPGAYEVTPKGEERLGALGPDSFGCVLG